MLAQFTVEHEPSIFKRIWNPIETILKTGADVFSRVAPYTIKTPYPITPTGTYYPPTTTDIRLQALRQRQSQPLNMTLPLMVIGGVILFNVAKKRR